MRSRIFKSVFAAGALVCVLCIALVLAVLYGHFASVQEAQLSSELALAAQGVEGQGISYLQGLEAGEERLTLVGADGVVLYDTWADASEMQNHADREEVAQALKTGSGKSSRYSSTLMEETLYEATLLSNGQVLRICATRTTPASLLLGMLGPICAVAILLLAASAILASRASRQIAAPLNALDLEHPLDNDAYDEIAPLLTKIEQERREVESRRRELASKAEEFDAVTRNMDEGLVLLNAERTVLFMNPAAREFYGVGDEDMVGRGFCVLDRDAQTAQMLDEAGQCGSSERVMERNGREYQLHASSMRRGGAGADAAGAAGGEDGIVLLIFDITDKAFAERNRREFTANVSHELKSPLHSIMGAAELIEAGLAKGDDVPQFASMVRKEAARLLALIEDIIRLSKLDEGAYVEFDAIELRDFAAGELGLLSQEAASKGVALRQEGDAVTCKASSQLLHEILYNLCENAIKYNASGGEVVVRTWRDDDFAVLQVSDDGIGIAPEDQGRVFERFYRVDKSHSRASGGTGLGLSIVKHAVAYLGGELSLESELGVGTSITVRIPAA